MQVDEPAEPPAAEVAPAGDADEADRLATAPALGVGLGFRKRAPVKKVVALNASIFGEEEAAPQKRTLVPIEYTEEELRAALVNEYAAAEGAEAGDGPKKQERDSRKRRDAERDAKKSLLSLIDSIPTGRAELFAHPVDWAVFDSLRLAETVSRWAAKKVAELLGEAEPSLVEFVTAQTAAHCAPDALLTELQDVLDDEAEAFVVKLWRLIIFETLKSKL
jgi:RNA-binding protein 25